MPLHKDKRKYDARDVRFAMQWNHRCFLIMLGLIGAVYMSLVAYRLSFPRVAPELAVYEGSSFRGALVPTGDVAVDARAFLDAAKRDQRTSSKDSGTNNSVVPPVASQPHALLGKPAPGFTLPNELQQTRTLAELNGKGPVVIVFYYGYHCSHCVAQLFALNDEIQRFRDQGVEIIAISPDSSEETSRKFAQYGKFDFPVLSDSDNAVAQKYGAYQAADDKTDEVQKHGTFLVNREGQVIWAYVGQQPFLDNDSLRFRLAENSIPKAEK